MQVEAFNPGGKGQANTRYDFCKLRDGVGLLALTRTHRIGRWAPGPGRQPDRPGNNIAFALASWQHSHNNCPGPGAGFKSPMPYTVEWGSKYEVGWFG